MDEDIKEELRRVENLPDEPEPWWKGPIKYILGIFLILLLVVWFFPSQAIKIDPEPKYIPTIEEVNPGNIELSSSKFEINSKYDYLKPIDGSNVAVKQIANKIVSLACDGNKVCQAKALYYFVRDNYDYISDPIRSEYVEEPTDFFLTGGGDCESGTILLASLLEGIGIETELVLVPRHAYLRMYLRDVSKGYLMDDGFVYLDWTCSTCKFGQISFLTEWEDKEII